MKLSYAEVRRRCLKPNMAEKPWYGKTVSHFFSTRIVWLLSDCSIHPDVFTTMSIAAGLCAAPFFSKIASESALIGALLFEFYYILDAVDGQWARLKQLQTKTGAFFDGVVTYLVQPALYFSIGCGLYRATRNPNWIMVGSIASFTTLWLSLLWHVRAATLLYFIQRSDGVRVKNKIVPSAATRPAAGRISNGMDFFKICLTFLQRSVTFPLTLNFLTLASVYCFTASRINPGFSAAGVFKCYLLWTAAAASAASAIMTASWILRKKIDRDWQELFDPIQPS